MLLTVHLFQFTPWSTKWKLFKSNIALEMLLISWHSSVLYTQFLTESQIPWISTVKIIISSVSHGISWHSTTFHLDAIELHWNDMEAKETMAIFCIPWNSMAFHNIPPGCHIIPMKCHGNSIETIETMAIFCIPWNSMAFHNIPPGCHRIPLKCHENNMAISETGGWVCLGHIWSTSHWLTDNF